jgi:hypothetical protein
MISTKSKKWLSCIALFVVLFSACKKDKEENEDPAGYWKGLYASGSLTPSQPYAVLFRPNGTVRVYSQSSDTSTGPKAEGTYKVNGSTITTSYTYFTGTITGSFSTTASSDGNSMEGSYGSGSSASGGGTFHLSRQ